MLRRTVPTCRHLSGATRVYRLSHLGLRSRAEGGSVGVLTWDSGAGDFAYLTQPGCAPSRATTGNSGRTQEPPPTCGTRPQCQAGKRRAGLDSRDRVPDNPGVLELRASRSQAARHTVQSSFAQSCCGAFHAMFFSRKRAGNLGRAVVGILLSSLPGPAWLPLRGGAV